MKIAAYIVFFSILVYLLLRMYDLMYYVRYLKDVGIPVETIHKMQPNEVIAAAKYLKRYAKTNRHFTVDDKDYAILSKIRTKYGIFT